jgi:hypothetical protein
MYLLLCLVLTKMALDRQMLVLRLHPQCNYMRSSLFWDVRQRRLVVSHRSFRTTYPSNLQESCVLFRYIPEGRRSHVDRFWQKSEIRDVTKIRLLAVGQFHAERRLDRWNDRDNEARTYSLLQLRSENGYNYSFSSAIRCNVKVNLYYSPDLEDV